MAHPNEELVRRGYDAFASGDMAVIDELFAEEEAPGAHDQIGGAGGFPEELGRVGGKLLSGEEYEVIETLVHAGWSIWLEPSAVVDHRVSSVRCRSRYYWRRLWWQGVSRARAREGHPR